jgi:hypothetical protein
VASTSIMTHAEQVAVRVLENDEVGSRSVPPRYRLAPSPTSLLDLARLIIGIQIEVKPSSLAGALLCRAIQRVRSQPRKD